MPFPTSWHMILWSPVARREDWSGLIISATRHFMACLEPHFVALCTVSLYPNQCRLTGLNKQNELMNGPMIGRTDNYLQMICITPTHLHTIML